MTVEVTTSRVVYVGDGDTGPFSIPFYFIDNADIKAIKVTIADGTEDALVLDTDFTLDGEGEEAGGTLTLTEALSSDYRLVIYRDPSALQETRYPRNDPFPAASHEMVADRLTMIVQRVLSIVTRGLRQPDGDADDIETLPAKATRASKYMAFDADGNPVATSGTGESAVITTFSETVLDDEDAGSWLTTLGFSTYFKTLISAASAAALRLLLGFPAVAAKGDLLAGSAADTIAKVSVGANGTVLTADSTATGGVSWQVTGFTTGDAKLTFKTAADTGWVMADDGSIGSASSSATNRANADTEALYTLLWTNVSDTYAPVATGRGASAAADFAANKAMTLPKALGRALAVAGAGSGLTSRSLGETVGTETHTLTGAQSGTSVHGHTASSSGTVPTEITGGTAGDGTRVQEVSTATTLGAVSLSLSTTVNNSSAANASEAHPNMQPSSFWNVMIKL